jgi:hypothetical protein
MSDVTYVSNKYQKFLSLFNMLNDAMNTYEASMNEYNDIVKTLASEDHKSDNRLVNNNNFFITKSNIMMKVKGSQSTEYETKKNKIVTIDNERPVYYYASKSFDMNGNNIENSFPNQIIQGGLSDLRFENIQSDYNNNKVLPDNINSDMSLNSSCNTEFAGDCASFAQMTNKKYYGLAQKTNEACECYTFDDPTSLNNSIEKYEKIDVHEKAFGADTTPLHYFGLMYDGKLHGLKQSNYSSNFSGVYNIDTDNTGIVDVTGDAANIDILNNNKCHPFVGSGPTNISVSLLDKNGDCLLK